MIKSFDNNDYDTEYATDFIDRADLVRDRKHNAAVAEVSEYDALKDAGNKPILKAQKQREFEQRTKSRQSRNKAFTVYHYYKWGKEKLQDLNVNEIIFNPSSELGAPIELSVLVDIPDQSKYGLYIPKGVQQAIPYSYVNGELLTKFHKNVDTEDGLYASHKEEWIAVLSNQTNKLKSLINSLAELPVARTTSFSGQTAHKQVYPLHWFRKDIQELEPYALIPIFNRAEADTLMLQVGRIVCGASVDFIKKNNHSIPTTRILEKFQNRYNWNIELNSMTHTHRTITVLCGNAGTGKSTLLRHLTGALSACGYSSSAIALSGNQFGWEKAEINDLLYSDDLSISDFKKLYKCSQLKTIASNGIYPAERKGCNARDAKAIAALILCCNETLIDEESYDEGCESRFHYLQTKEPSQIQRELGSDYNIYIEKLCHKLKTTPTVLFQWFLRVCLDKFLDAIGYRWDEEQEAFIIHDYPKLKEILDENKKNYIAATRGNLELAVVAANRKVQIINNLIEESGLADTKLLNPNEENDKGFNVSNQLQTAAFISGIRSQINECKVHPDGDEIKPGFEKTVQELKQIQDWVLSSEIFNSNEVDRWYRNTAYKIIENPKNISTVALWNESIKLFATNNRGRLKTGNQHYLTALCTAKNAQSTYRKEVEEMWSEFETGTLAKLRKIKAKYKTFTENHSYAECR